jgi:DNA polymerase-3 subunit epsilon
MPARCIDLGFLSGSPGITFNHHPQGFPMNQSEDIVSLDTETTGFHANGGDRMVEIGAVKIRGNMETGETFHRYINPQGRKVDPGALAVHNLSDDFLKDKEPFRRIVDDFLKFVGDAKIVIHNAKFDMGFLNMEFERCNRPILKNEVIDSLTVAKKRYAGQRNTLDALCTRLGVDASGREYHGALIDSLLLARVWIKMTRLDQLQLADAATEGDADFVVSAALDMIPRKRRESSLVVPASAAELLAHGSFFAHKLFKESGKPILWKTCE